MNFKRNLISVEVSDAIANRFRIEDSKVYFNPAMMDGDSGIAFMISQLSVLEPELYEVPYADIFFEELVPIDTSIAEHAQSVNYRSFDGVTMGKFIGSSADDLPSVQMSAELHIVPLGYAGNSVKYSLNELRESVATGMPVDSTQMELAYRGAKEHQQKIVLFGDEKRKMHGLLNHPNVTKTNSTVDWNTAKVDDILDDINRFISGVWIDTKQKFMPNTLLIDTQRYAFLASKRLAEMADKTLLKYIQENNIANLRGVNLDIRPLPHLSAEELAANGVAGNKDRMVAYAKDKKNLVAYMPIVPRFVAPQYDNLIVKIPMEYKISGTEFRYPMSAAYCDFDTAITNK